MTNTIRVKGSSTGTAGSKSTFKEITGSKPTIMLFKFAEDYAEEALR
jgi:hypothetical protein